MPHSTNKELIVGIMVGTAGISLLVLWYHKIRKASTAVNLPKFVSLGNTCNSITFQDEMRNGQGTAVIFQRRQLQILEKLNELLTNVEELKEEIRFLKETIPKLEEYIQDELGGKITVHKISPQHRARKRKLTTVQSTATSNSSEEAESEGGCCKEDQNFQPNCTEDQVTSLPQHHEASSILRPHVSLDLKTSRPSATHEVNSTTGSRKLSYPSNTSDFSLLSARRKSLSLKFRKSSIFLYQRESRANFDFQEDASFSDSKSSDHFGAFRSRRRFTSPRLSIVSYYNSAMFFDPQSSSQDMFNPNEIEMFSRSPSHPDAEKHTIFSKPDYSLVNLEARALSSAHRNTADRASHQESVASFFSLQTFNSSTSLTNEFAIALQETGQLSKDSRDLFHSESLSHSTNNSPTMTQQRLSQSVTPRVFHNVGYSSSYKNASSFALSQNEVTSGPFQEENISVSSQDEEKPSPIEIPKIRYITANTDTEEQSFPGTKAFNIHVEQLKLDALLQKVDHLRMNESDKMESFELLCDHKEKFKDEAEYMWRLVRAYGDMCMLSTNVQEKKHYANIGKTLGERAVARAPMNGYCHLWYAVLCGQVSEFEGLQNKINYGHHFKEHLDIAITLIPEEPYLYYLKGRYCYTISKLSWIEKKMAATLFGKIPSSNVQEALHNFLQAEELHPGFSVSNYMYLAKSYIDLNETQNAWKVCHLALLLPVVTKEDKEAIKEVKKIMTSLKR